MFIIIVTNTEFVSINPIVDDRVAELNYHINKFEPTTVSKTCPHCLMEEETINHFIAQCPKWSYERGGYFDSFYLSVTDIVDKLSLPRIIGFIQATKRFTKCGCLYPITDKPPIRREGGVGNSVM